MPCAGDDVKRKPGRPAFAPTGDDARALVELHVANGTTQREIAAALKISRTTLEKHFRHELDNGQNNVIGQVLVRLFDVAMGKTSAEPRTQVTAMLAIMNNIGGWNNPHRVVHQNPDGSGLFEETPIEKLLPALKRTVEVLEWQSRKGERKIAE